MRMSIAAAALLFTADASADPCGMVPPLSVRTTDTRQAIQRTGAQRTYVFYRDGIETIALRPGFEGNIDDFGMLIPFPSPPAIRKIDDDTFAHIEGTLAPPNIHVNIRDRSRMYPSATARRSAVMAAPSAMEGMADSDGLSYQSVRVVREEAVGMYEVAVLEAGSPAALSRWMTEHGYRYPEGMDDVTAEYVAEGWCFVAIKARIGAADSVEPRPGMRSADPQLPSGASFDGHVQGMGFRFHVDEPVVPMRLSVFNGEDPRNVVYMLSDKPMTIAGAPLDLVAGQLTGDAVHDRLTAPLTTHYHGGQLGDLSRADQQSIQQKQDPTPYVRTARDLFAADLLAVRTGTLSLAHEELEKSLLNISEQLSLRGEEMDALYDEALAQERGVALDGALDDIREMHFTVIDGVLPGELLAEENLTFAYYRAPLDAFHQRQDPLRPANMTLWMYR